MDLLTIEEARKRLGISDSTMRRWIRQGKIKPQEIAHRYYFSEQDITRLLPKRSQDNALSQRISILEQEVIQLRERVDLLEHAQRTVAPSISKNSVSTRPERYTTRYDRAARK